MKYNFKAIKLSQFFLIGVLLIICMGLEYYFHFLLGIEIVYTHLFYIPIVLAAIWWGLKGGLPVSLVLAFLHFGSHFPKVELSILSRGFAFMLVGSVIGIVSDKLKRVEKKLQKKDEVKAVFRSAGGGIRAINTDYKIIDQNKEMDVLCGVKKAEAVGKKCSEIFRGSHCGTDKCTLRQILSGAERIETEMERTTKGGKTAWVNLIATPFKDEKEKIVGVIESFIDITERKKAENALQESEGRLKTILETSQVGIAIIDAETHEIIDINPKALRLLDASREQVVGNICHKHICPAEKGRCPITDLRQIIDESERILLKVSGGEIPILKSVVPVTLNGRKCLLESFMDITEYKKAEDALREGEELKSSILKSISRAVVVLCERQITFANEGVETVFGWKPEELIGQTTRVLYGSEEEFKKIGEHFYPKVEKQGIYSGEFFCRRKDGKDIMCMVTVSMIGKTLKDKRVVVVYEDITERKKAEEHIERLNEVLSTIGKVNALMVKEDDPQKLLKKACKIFAGSREYKSAGAVLFENDKLIFQTVACKPGYEDKKFALIASAKKFTPCIKKALKEKTAIIARKKGVGSLCAGCIFPEEQRCPEKVIIPLSYKEKVFGMLLVGSDIAQVFDSEEIKLLKEVCEDIGFALESIEKEKRRRGVEEKLQKRVLELTTLSEISTDIGSTLKLDKVLNLSLESAIKLLNAECGSIMLLDEEEKLLTVVASSCLNKEFAKAKERLGEGIAGYVTKTGEPLLLKKDLKDTRFEKYKKKRKIKDALSVPIRTKDKIIGAFNVDNKREKTFTQGDLRLFTILASEVGAAIENAKLYQDIRKGLLNTVEALAMAVDAKDPYTQGHSDRVVKYSLAIAKEMGLPRNKVEEIEIAARLHDVGKIGVSEEILGKPSPLTEKEWKMVRAHPETSAKILEPVDFPSSIVSCILSHHERLDGKGYPNGLSKDKIPLGASIIKVADAYDAMTSNRPYRKALSKEKAISELKKYKGTQFHPEVVEAFLRFYEREQKGKRAKNPELI